MIYHLFEYLTRQGIALPFSRLFTYVSFRVGLALIVALLISTIWGSKVIDFLRRKQIGELVRDLGLEGEQTKKGTPTMGGGDPGAYAPLCATGQYLRHPDDRHDALDGASGLC